MRGVAGLAQAAGVILLAILAVTLGGAASAGVAANALLELAGVVALAGVAMRRWPRPLARAERQLLGLLAVFALLYGVQLLPLPPAAWTLLPGHGVVVTGLEFLGIAQPWMPLSLAPPQTVHSALALIPPAAMIAMIARFERSAARDAIVAFLALTFISMLLGVAQFSGSGAYVYAYSNTGSATGFFANANHFATLMCMSMPLAAGLVARWRSAVEGQAAASRTFALAVLLAVILLALLGIAMTKSVAGLLLAVVALAGSAAIVLSGLPRTVRFGFLGGATLVIAVAGAVVFTTTRADFGIDVGVGQDLSRPTMWSVTLQAIRAFSPAGSGFGTFQHVYHLFEDPAAIGPLFANHAHNDLLEFILEGGVAGGVLLLVFLLWFVRRVLQVWVFDRRRDPLAQGAAIAAVIVLLHSLVDYPLRTEAIATLFAVCLAALARGNACPVEADPSATPTAARHLSA